MQSVGLNAWTYSNVLQIEQRTISNVNVSPHVVTYFSSHVWSFFEEPKLHIFGRVYHVFVLGSMLILITFTSMKTQTVTVTVSDPSLIAYKELRIRRSSTLECACSHSTMPYESFVSLSSSFHQICSSGFVDSRWISLLAGASQGTGADFVWVLMSGKFFGAVSSLCKLADETVTYNINNFLAQTFATNHVLIENDFYNQLKTTINQFIESIVTSFSLSIQTTSLLTQVDQPLIGKADSNVVLQSQFDIYQDTTQPSSPVCFSVYEISNYFF